MLRIGRIGYANCTPIFKSLQILNKDSNYQLIEGVPSYLNQMLASDKIDVCPSSSILFSKNPEKYLILPDLSISSCGPVLSVLLFSKVPIENLNAETVLLSSQSDTSINLLKILLKQRFGFDCLYQVTDKTTLNALEDGSAVLLIGDAALRTAQSCVGDVYIYDLGELWFKWTGLPFVFALWLTTRNAVVQFGDEFKILLESLIKAKSYAVNYLKEIADVSPEAAWMGAEVVWEYWKILSYDLSGAHIEGLRLFYKLAFEQGLIDVNPELFFLEI